MLASVLLVCGILIFALPVGTRGPLRPWIKRLGWLPVLPIAVIGAIVVMKGGGYLLFAGCAAGDTAAAMVLKIG